MTRPVQELISIDDTFSSCALVYLLLHITKCLKFEYIVILKILTGIELLHIEMLLCLIVKSLFLILLERLQCVWNKQGREIWRKPTGQPRYTIERQNRCFKQLALRNLFSTTSEFEGLWFEKKGTPVSMRTLYRLIWIFGSFSYRF